MPPLTPEQVRQLKGQLRLLMGNADKAVFNAAMAELEKLAQAPDPAEAFGGAPGVVAEAFKAWSSLQPASSTGTPTPDTASGYRLATDLTLGGSLTAPPTAPPPAPPTAPPPAPPTAPPTQPPAGGVPGYRGAELTPAEIAQRIADYRRFIPGVTDEEIKNLLQAEGAPKGISPSVNEQEMSMMRAALRESGITNATPDELTALMALMKAEFNDKWLVGDYAATDFNGFLAQKVPDIARTQQELRAKTEAKAKAKVEEEVSGKVREGVKELRAAQRKLAEAHLNEATAALGQRYPKNKALIDNVLKPAILERWDKANAKGQEEWGDLSPEMREILGLGRLTEVSMRSFLEGFDIEGFAEELGFGADWHDGLWEDDLEATVFSPIRKAAKTPQEIARAEDMIAKLKTSDLRARFKFAQRSNPGLTAANWLVGEEAGGIMRNALALPTPPPQTLADRQQALDDAFEANYAEPLRRKAVTPEQIAQTEALIAKARESLPRLAQRFQTAQSGNPNLTAADYLAGAEAQGILDVGVHGPPPRLNPVTGAVEPGSFTYIPGGPGGYTSGPPDLAAGQRTGTPLGQGRKEALLQAANYWLSRGLSNRQIVDQLRLGLQYGGNEVEAAFVLNLPFDPNIGIQERTAAVKLYNQSTAAGQLAAWGANQGLLSPAWAKIHMDAAAAGATGILEAVQAELARAFQVKADQEGRVGSLQASLVGLQQEAAGGAAKWLEGFVGATPNWSSPNYDLVQGIKFLFGTPGGREYAQSSLEELARQYAQETNRRLADASPAMRRWIPGPPEEGGGAWSDQLQIREVNVPATRRWIPGPPEEGGGMWSDQTQILPLPSFRNYIQSHIPRIAGEFRQIYEKNQAAFQDPEFKQQYGLAAQSLTAEGVRRRASDPTFDVATFVQEGLKNLSGQHTARKAQIKAARPVYGHAVI